MVNVCSLVTVVAPQRKNQSTIGRVEVSTKRPTYLHNLSTSSEYVFKAFSTITKHVWSRSFPECVHKKTDF